MRGFIVVAALFGAVGCGFVQIVPANGAGDPSEAPRSDDFESHPLAGAECDLREEPESTRFMVLARVCKHASDDRSTRLEELHSRFDDRRPDQLAAAVITHAAARHDTPITTGIGAYYAGLVEPSALKAAVDRVDVSTEARAFFVKAALSAKSKVEQRAAKLDARRKHLYLEVPGAVVAKRRAYFSEHAAAYTKLDALETQIAQAHASKRPALDLAPALTAIRGEYFAACTSDECRFEPLPVAVTRALANLYVSANEPLLAAAEGSLLRSQAAERHLFGFELSTAIFQAMTEERRDADLYEKAKREGVDQASLTARFGDPAPIAVDPSSAWLGRLPERSRFSGTSRFWGNGEQDPGYRSQSGIVTSVADAKKTGPHGERLSVVSFRPVVSTEDIESCRETGKVSGVTWDSSNHAHLNYESVCTPVGKKTNVEKVAPVLVPAAEVANVKRGETLVVYVTDDTHVGVVVTSYTTTSATTAKVAANGKKGKKGKAASGDRTDAASDKPRTVTLQVRGERIGGR